MSESVIMFTALQAHIEAGTIVPRLVRETAQWSSNNHAEAILLLEQVSAAATELRAKHKAAPLEVEAKSSKRLDLSQLHAPQIRRDRAGMAGTQHETGMRGLQDESAARLAREAPASPNSRGIDNHNDSTNSETRVQPPTLPGTQAIGQRDSSLGDRSGTLPDSSSNGTAASSPSRGHRQQDADADRTTGPGSPELRTRDRGAQPSSNIDSGSRAQDGIPESLQGTQIHGTRRVRWRFGDKRRLVLFTFVRAVLEGLGVGAGGIENRGKGGGSRQAAVNRGLDGREGRDGHGGRGGREDPSQDRNAGKGADSESLSDGPAEIPAGLREAVEPLQFLALSSLYSRRMALQRVLVDVIPVLMMLDPDFAEAAVLQHCAGVDENGEADDVFLMTQASGAQSSRGGVGRGGMQGAVDDGHGSHEGQEDEDMDADASTRASQSLSGKGVHDSESCVHRSPSDSATQAPRSLFAIQDEVSEMGPQGTRMSQSQSKRLPPHRLLGSSSASNGSAKEVLASELGLIGRAIGQSPNLPALFAYVMRKFILLVPRAALPLLERCCRKTHIQGPALSLLLRIIALQDTTLNCMIGGSVIHAVAHAGADACQDAGSEIRIGQRAPVAVENKNNAGTVTGRSMPLPAAALVVEDAAVEYGDGGDGGLQTGLQLAHDAVPSGAVLSVLVTAVLFPFSVPSLHLPGSRQRVFTLIEAAARLLLVQQQVWKRWLVRFADESEREERARNLNQRGVWLDSRGTSRSGHPVELVFRLGASSNDTEARAMPQPQPKIYAHARTLALTTRGSERILSLDLDHSSRSAVPGPGLGPPGMLSPAASTQPPDSPGGNQGTTQGTTQGGQNRIAADAARGDAGPKKITAGSGAGNGFGGLRHQHSPLQSVLRRSSSGTIRRSLGSLRPRGGAIPRLRSQLSAQSLHRAAATQGGHSHSSTPISVTSARQHGEGAHPHPQEYHGPQESRGQAMHLVGARGTDPAGTKVPRTNHFQTGRQQVGHQQAGHQQAGHQQAGHQQAGHQQNELHGLLAPDRTISSTRSAVGVGVRLEATLAKGDGSKREASRLLEPMSMGSRVRDQVIATFLGGGRRTQLNSPFAALCGNGINRIGDIGSTSTGTGARAIGGGGGEGGGDADGEKRKGGASREQGFVSGCDHSECEQLSTPSGPPFLASSFLDALSILVQLLGVTFPRETITALRQAAMRSREVGAVLAWMLHPVAGVVLAGDVLTHSPTEGQGQGQGYSASGVGVPIRTPSSSASPSPSRQYSREDKRHQGRDGAYDYDPSGHKGEDEDEDVSLFTAASIAFEAAAQASVDDGIATAPGDSREKETMKTAGPAAPVWEAGLHPQPEVARRMLHVQGLVLDASRTGAQADKVHATWLSAVMQQYSAPRRSVSARVSAPLAPFLAGARVARLLAAADALVNADADSTRNRLHGDGSLDHSGSGTDTSIGSSGSSASSGKGTADSDSAAAPVACAEQAPRVEAEPDFEARVMLPAGPHQLEVVFQRHLRQMEAWRSRQLQKRAAAGDAARLELRASRAASDESRRQIGALVEELRNARRQVQESQTEAHKLHRDLESRVSRLQGERQMLGASAVARGEELLEARKRAEASQRGEELAQESKVVAEGRAESAERRAVAAEAEAELLREQLLAAKRALRAVVSTHGSLDARGGSS